MKISKIQLQHRIAVAAKQVPADLVIKNGRILNVFTQEVTSGDIAIADGAFVGIGEYEGHKELDAKNKYVSPGFIDGHVHIESAMITPSEFAKVVTPHGVTSIVADPHEIANVAGVEGIQYMIDSAKGVPLSIYFMLPSCVPATPFENAGATLRAQDLEPFYNQDSTLGLGEVMDYPSVESASDQMLDKLLSALQKNMCIDGHAAGVPANGINVYMTSGIQTDHECINQEEAEDRLSRGMYVMLREGSAAKDLRALLKAVNEKNARRCLFVTDDKHLDDLIAEGSIDHNIRICIEEGIDPLLAYQMATLNAAECFGLKQKGAIAPGYDADFLLIDCLEEVSITHVYKAGKLIAENGECLTFDSQPPLPPAKLTSSVNILPLRNGDLEIKICGKHEAAIIGIIPNSIVTEKLIEQVELKNDIFYPSVERDHLKLAVVERHHRTGNVGLGIVKGMGLKSGAIASTVAHDSHNIVACGTNDVDIRLAIETIESMQGGLVVINEGTVMAALPLPIAGLMSNSNYKDIAFDLEQVNAALEKIGFNYNFNPFLTLSFLALPVIPELKLTDLGLFDVRTFKHVSYNGLEIE